MNEQEKQSNNDRNIGVYVIVLVLICIFFYLFCGRSTGDVTGNDNDIQGTVQRAQDDNQRAGAALDGVRNEISAAGAELAGANRDAERAEGIARQNAETLRHCRELLEQGKAANQRAEQIFREIERANQALAEGTAPARNPG